MHLSTQSHWEKPCLHQEVKISQGMLSAKSLFFKLHVHVNMHRLSITCLQRMYPVCICEMQACDNQFISWQPCTHHCCSLATYQPCAMSNCKHLYQLVTTASLSPSDDSSSLQRDTKVGRKFLVPSVEQLLDPASLIPMVDCFLLQ